MASHAGDTGSIPVGTTNNEIKGLGHRSKSFFIAEKMYFQPYFQPLERTYR